MKKKIFVSLTGAMFVSSIGFAAPVVDVAKGDTYVDVSYNRLKADFGGGYDDVKFGTTEIALTHGLTDKLALTLGYTKTQNKTVFEDTNREYEGEGYYYEETLQLKAKVKMNDVKLQYKANKNFAPFIGYKKWEVDGSYIYTNTGEGTYTETGSDSYDKSGLQFGFIYNTKIADKTNFFGTAAFGNDIKEYKVGFGYDVAENTTLEVNYKKITLEEDDGADADFKGVGFGVNYKF